MKVEDLEVVHSRKTKSLKDRFFEKVDVSDGCWMWRGSTMGSGYGGFHVGGKKNRRMIGAHRVSYLIHKGEISDGMAVMHACDVRLCVNPSHLSLGTKSDNMSDAAQKGRVCTIGKSRLTHCHNGHAFTVENTYRNKNGHRRCYECQRIGARSRHAAIRARGDKT